jgi:predicted amidophosphoribosyltransferase
MNAILRSAAGAGGTILTGLVDLLLPNVCPRCGASPLPRFSRVFRLGPYAQPLKRAIRDLKYRGQAGVTRQLCHLLAQVVETIEEDAKPDILVPVPMY